MESSAEFGGKALEEFEREGGPLGGCCLVKKTILEKATEYESFSRNLIFFAEY